MTEKSALLELLQTKMRMLAFDMIDTMTPEQLEEDIQDHWDGLSESERARVKGMIDKLQKPLRAIQIRLRANRTLC